MTQAVADRFRASPNYISTAPGIAFAYLGDYERGRPDIVHHAESLSALACVLGLSGSHQLAEAAQVLPAGPFIALGPVQPMLTTTEGSAAADAQCRLLDSEGRAIAGLYGAGCIGQGGLLLRGHGLHLAWTFTSGRIAGAQAAARAATV
jgi:fumarate reductase flavoprotein subunit